MVQGGLGHAIALVSGPALGHLARLRVVADHLSAAGADVHFIVPSNCRHLDLALCGNYRVDVIDIKPVADEPQFVRFGRGLAECAPYFESGLVVFDLNPML